MNEPRTVCDLKGLRCFREHPGHEMIAMTRAGLIESPSIDELHDVIRRVVIRIETVNTDDAWIIEAGCRTSFAFK